MKKKENPKLNTWLFLLIGYVLLVLHETVFGRTLLGYRHKASHFLWSYEAWLMNGDRGIGRQILLNIAMFMPYGFLLTACLSRTKTSRKTAAVIVLLSALLFSCLIEILQYELRRGLFEYDDILDNTIGAVLGYAVYRGMRRICRKRLALHELECSNHKW